MSDATPSEQKAATTSLGDLLAEVSRDISTLMRQEVALAKAELKETAAKTAKGAGLLGGAGYAGLMAVLLPVDRPLVGSGRPDRRLGWSAVIVAVIWAVIAAILYAIGRSRLNEVDGAPQTVETLKEIPETLKRNEENR